MNKIKNEKLYFSFLIVTSMLFAEWTLGVHLAAFLKISWNTLVNIFLIMIIPSLFIFNKLSNILYKEFKFQTQENLNYEINISKNWLFSLPLFLCLLYINNFTYQIFYILMFAVLLKFIFQVEINAIKIKNNELLNNKELIQFVLILLTPIIIVIFTHRSDYDDVEYLQFAMQSNNYPDLPPSTFDSSLGFLIYKFRFLPYKFVSYELLSGMISKSTNINIFNIYYIFIPILFSVVSSLSFYFLFRWFLTKEMAIIALLLCVLILVCWGDTHTSFGNRVYVRLFQGKANIVAIVTPLTILFGLMLINSRKLIVLLGLIIAGIMSIGFSANGIVISVILGFLLGLIALINKKNFFINSIYLFVGFLYPLLLAIYIKLEQSSEVKLSSIGSVLPITASFGNFLRQALMLMIICLCLFVFSNGIKWIKNSNSLTSKLHWLFALIVVVLLFPINPLFTEFFAGKSSANMAWRLAWAAPIPFIIAISLTIFIGQGNKVNKKSGLLLVSACILFCFLFAERWTIAASNRANWGSPSSNLPAEYYETDKIVTEIKKLNNSNDPITILLDPHLAAWIPIIDKNIKVIMLGHNFKNGIINIINKDDYEARNLLINDIYSSENINKKTIEVIKKYKVNFIVVKNTKLFNELPDELNIDQIQFENYLIINVKN